MRFMARLNAPTYPDAAQIASTTPDTSANPAPGEVAMSPSGPCSAFAASGANPATMSVIAFAAFSPWPMTPSTENTAMSAGNSDSTA
jgi:hypothetical protein